MTLLGSWMEFRFQLNAGTSILSRTHSIVVMTVILWSITSLRMVLMEKSIFCGGEFPWKLGRRHVDGEISTHNQKKIVSTRSVWIRASPGAEKRLERSSAPSPKGLTDVSIETSGSTFCESAAGIRHFIRRASGGCDCREPSPAGRSASQATTFSGGWSLRPSS